MEGTIICRLEGLEGLSTEKRELLAFVDLCGDMEFQADIFVGQDKATRSDRSNANVVKGKLDPRHCLAILNL